VNVVPGAPTSVAATVASATSATVTFTAPSSNGGTAITDYFVTATDAAHSGDSVTAFDCSVSASPCLVTGLTAGESYTFTVAAANAQGTGSYSAASSALIVNVVPGAPTSVAATVASATSATVHLHRAVVERRHRDHRLLRHRHRRRALRRLGHRL